jgi:hypothetical protein
VPWVRCSAYPPRVRHIHVNSGLFLDHQLLKDFEAYGDNCMIFVFCVVRLLFVFTVLFVCKCVHPPGDNPVTVNKYIISYIIWGSHSDVDVDTGVLCGLLYYPEDGSSKFRRNVGVYISVYLLYMTLVGWCFDKLGIPSLCTLNKQELPPLQINILQHEADERYVGYATPLFTVHLCASGRTLVWHVPVVCRIQSVRDLHPRLFHI